ncbi:PREDICTED: 5-hydroxytryptamine receptor 2A [Papilio xuthus]|uniref:5-hydroxytryptamine receptor 2A n=1 Tax=Papilio xuthus TaxID=66420 RepID=A0AAJ6ZAA9_PAPXU|nr:PREDICTED: 5-hydroxytryptamine receptor 2A [Papilio xuthus]
MDVASIMNITYLDLITDDLQCHLKTVNGCGNAHSGLECTRTEKSLDYFCEFNFNTQNETSYSCFKCSNNNMDLNYTVCDGKLKSNMLSFVFESAIKTFWLKLPEFNICDWDTLFCYNNDRTLYMDVNDSAYNISDVQTVQCKWNVKNFTINSLESVGYEWSFLFVILFIIAGGVGNILVCLAVCLDKRLQNVTNYFLLSLAIADLLVSLFVMPMGAIPGFLGYWPLGVVWCNVYVTCDVLACSASIMHMCFISIGRYLGIRNPLKSRHHSTKRVVVIKIALVWLLSMFVSSSITVLGIINQTNIMPTPELCVINNRLFWVFGSLVAFYIPMLMMVVSFALTVQLLKRQALLAATPVPGGTQRRQCGGFDNGPSQGPRRIGAKSSPDLSPSGNSSRHMTWRITSTNRGQRNKIGMSVSNPQLSYMNGCGNGAGSARRGRDVATQTPASIAAETRRARLRPLKLNIAPPNALNLRFLTNRKKGRSLSANAVANEQKATKVLGLVFFTFVLCWAPFFLLNILFASCPACIVPDHIVNVCLWLGYVSSTINPIIYTVFNRTFRAAFLRLLKCHCSRRGHCTRYMSGGSTRGASQLCARSALPLAISLRPSVMPTTSSGGQETTESVLIEAPLPGFNMRY